MSDSQQPTTIQKISENLPANFETLQPLEKLEQVLYAAIEVLGIKENLILVNGDLTVSEFLAPHFKKIKILELLSQSESG